MSWELSPRVVAAALAIVAWVVLCVWCERRARRESAARRHDAVPAGGTVLVTFASQTGFAEELARDTAARVTAAGMHAQVVSLEALAERPWPHDAPVFVVASTTGEGDPPDAVADFAATTMARPAALTGVRYGLLALGDHGYAQYCAFGRALDEWLVQSGAEAVFPRVEVNAGEPSAVMHLHREVAEALGFDANRVATGPAWTPCTLVSRQHVNAGSPGAPAWRVALAVAPTVTWNAGDIAVLAVGDEDDAPVREYSIATLRGEATLDLLIREMRAPDGTLGRGSRFLLHDVAVGDTVRLRIRRNRGFHVPDDDVPVLLVGNGTGIAALRALVAERARTGRGRNWLVFGERTRAHDLHFADDLSRWTESGTLERIDLALSREDAGARYVQDVLLAARDDVRAWIDAGAVIYVCGSEKGMAPGVDTALREILGAETVTALRRAHRYRRDVY